MSKAKASRKPKPEPSAVIDVSIHFSTYIVQHVAIRDDRPISQWNGFQDIVRVARRVQQLLPRREAGISAP
jgi:hypothetical protein